jgi:tetratricopeptide (TPR) repeat protein
MMAALLFPLWGKEMSRPLRQASEYLRIGRLAEARDLAASVQKAFPDDLEALLLLGRIDFERRDYRTAKLWFQAAARQSPRHPLVGLYRKMFQEMEHRLGETITDFGPVPRADKTETARAFRRGWFGPNFPHLSAKVPEPPPPPPTVVPTPVTVGVLEARSEDFAAHEALQKGWFLKAYLLYKDLVRAAPDQVDFRISLAQAAQGMRRYPEARKLLGEALREDPENLRAQALWRSLPTAD